MGVYAPTGQRVYHDDGISGYNLERPALQQLLFDAKRKVPATVGAWHVRDRHF